MAVKLALLKQWQTNAFIIPLLYYNENVKVMLVSSTIEILSIRNTIVHSGKSGMLL